MKRDEFLTMDSNTNQAADVTLKGVEDNPGIAG